MDIQKAKLQHVWHSAKSYLRRSGSAASDVSYLTQTPFDVSFDDAFYGKVSLENYKKTIVDYLKENNPSINAETNASTRVSTMRKLIELREELEKEESNFDFNWIAYYKDFSKKLVAIRHNRKDFINYVRTLPNTNYVGEDCCPFTLMGIFNRGLKLENRISLMSIFGKKLGVTARLPFSLQGIPVLDSRKALIYRTKNGQSNIEKLWDLFEEIVQFDSPMSETNRSVFKTLYDEIRTDYTASTVSLTFGFYWIRPDLFVALDGNNRDFMERHYGINNLPKNISAVDYLNLCDTVRAILTKPYLPPTSIASMSAKAWVDHGQQQIEETQVILERPLPPQNIAVKTETPRHLNTILYGPPGTGKTYSTAIHAVAAIEKISPADLRQRDSYSSIRARYDEYRQQGLIEFVTFHQSYGYEEFIEGIRPQVDDTTGSMSFVLEDGIFKSFCKRALADEVADSSGLGISPNATIWKVSLNGTGDNPVRTDCLENGYVRIGWDNLPPVVNDETIDLFPQGAASIINAFANVMKEGDVIVSCYDAWTTDAIGIVEGPYEVNSNFETHQRMRRVKWLVSGIRENVSNRNGGKEMTLSTVYRLNRLTTSDILEMLEANGYKHQKAFLSTDQRVMIIDEINRGNISKIFGELITLIEPTKRIGTSEELFSKLPYSKENFGVPANVHIIGTMNTADRSLAFLDTALRRRFDFEEVLPDLELLRSVTVQGIDVRKMLETINRRIEVLIDGEHVIGHAYFMSLLKDPSIEELSRIFIKSIIPLLKEYFFDDYEKIALVLGGDAANDCALLTNVTDDYHKIFPKSAYLDGNLVYQVNKKAFTDSESYTSIYRRASSSDENSQAL